MPQIPVYNESKVIEPKSPNRIPIFQINPLVEEDSKNLWFITVCSMLNHKAK
jgi:hypothetical protein